MFEAALLPIRGVQLLLSIICLGLAAYLCSGVYSFGEASFNVFTSVWTLLVLGYLILVSVKPAFGHKWALVALDALTMVFWFAAFIAIAAVQGSIYYYYGSRARSVSIALAIFGAFEWLLFVATTVMDVFTHLRGGGNNAAAPAPAMQGV